MRKYIALVLALVCVLALGGCSSFGGINKENPKTDVIKNDDTNTEQSEIIEWVVAKLKSEITFEDKDTLTFSDSGHLISIDIKFEDTAEMLFHCIRNCRSITDLTGAALEPEHLPILINGNEIGGFERIYSKYPETGQFFSFNFAEEDTAVFYEYVMALKD